MALIGTCLAGEPPAPEPLRLFREHAVPPRRAALCQVLEQARGRSAPPAETDPEPLVSALPGPFCADRLAGRADASGWAHNAVQAILGTTADNR